METKGKKVTQTFEASKPERSSVMGLQIPVFRYNWQFFRNWGYEKKMPEIFILVILEKWKQLYRPNENYEVRTVQFKWVRFWNKAGRCKDNREKLMSLNSCLTAAPASDKWHTDACPWNTPFEADICIRFQCQNHSEQEVWTTLSIHKPIGRDCLVFSSLVQLYHSSGQINLAAARKT